MHAQRHKQNLTLVLGGTGKTGRRVAERLQQKGHDCPDRIPFGSSTVRLGQ